MTSTTSPNLVLSATPGTTPAGKPVKVWSLFLSKFPTMQLSQASAHQLRPNRPQKETPLIVALHGGSYSADYYNATLVNSAPPYSTFLGVPFIAINRPGYKDSTALPDALPEGRTFLQVEGRYFHNEILPAVWKAYAADYGVISIVVLAHSLSAPMTIVAAALNATETTPSSNKQSQDQEQEDGKVERQGPERG